MMASGCASAPGGQAPVHQIYDREGYTVNGHTADGYGFTLTGPGTWSFNYEVVGQPEDLFTACIVEDADFQQWVNELTPERASGQACMGPTSLARASGTLSEGAYDLGVFCWDENTTCDLTVTLTTSA